MPIKIKPTTVKTGDILYCKKTYVNPNTDIFIKERVRITGFFGEKYLWYWMANNDGDTCLCGETDIDIHFTRKIERAKRIVKQFIDG